MADAMKLVPVEVTGPMMIAGCEALPNGGTLSDARKVWSAMLDASPPAGEEAPAEGAGDEALDGTDAAHPAWWRGHEQTAQVLCQKVVSILDGEDDGSGVANDPWESVRRRLIALRDRTSEPAREGVPDGVYWSAENQNFYRMETRKGCGTAFYVEWRDRVREFPAEPHPAPATSDKLRVAVGLLNDCIWLDTDTGDYRVEHDGSVEKARAILATLNEDSL